MLRHKAKALPLIVGLLYYKLLWLLGWCCWRCLYDCVCRKERMRGVKEKMYILITQWSVFISFFLSILFIYIFLFSFFPVPLSFSVLFVTLPCPTMLTPPLPDTHPHTLFCPHSSIAALASHSIYPMPLSLSLLSPSLSLTSSLLSFSAVQHSDYHSSHRVRPDSQILLSTLLHHLLLEGAMERERLRQKKEKAGKGDWWTAE